MFAAILTQIHFVAISYTLAILLAIFFAIFLFWRGGRHELIDSEELFDLMFVSSIGAFLFGRVFEFIANPDRFHFLFTRLLFFNAFGGLDFYGVISGIFVSLFVYLRHKKTRLWHILDIAAGPLVFAQAIVTIGNLLSGTLKGKEVALPFLKFAGARYPVGFFYLAGYFLIFVFLKRLESRKRHAGFFICFYLVTVGLLDAALYFFRVDTARIGKFPFHLVMPLAFLVVAVALWHVLAKRSVKDDIKGFFALGLLTVLALKRALRDFNEAGKLSRVIVLSPYFLVRLILGLIKILAKEIKFSFIEALIVFGVKHDRT